MELLDSLTPFSPAGRRPLNIGRLMRLGIPSAASQVKNYVLTSAIVLGGQLVLVSASIHLALWILQYRAIPIIGELFIVQGLAGLAVGAAIIGTRKLPALVAGVGYMVASIGGLISSAIGDGIFGFQDGFDAPWAKQTLGFEAVGLLIMAAVAVSMLISMRKDA